MNVEELHWRTKAAELSFIFVAGELAATELKVAIVPDFRNELALARQHSRRPSGEGWEI